MARGRRRTQAAEGEETSRVSFSSKAARTEDEPCKVRVYLTGMDIETGKPLPNNITKTLFIGTKKEPITVTEAAETIAGAFE